MNTYPKLPGSGLRRAILSGLAIGLWLLALPLTPASATEPLVYEGRLTGPGPDEDGLDVFPVLRFSIVGPDGTEQWAQVVDPENAGVAYDNEGNFVVVLDNGWLADGGFGPPSPAMVADDARLLVERCETAACAAFESLGAAQPIGAVPVALMARDVAPEAVQRAVFQMTDLVVSQNPGPGQFGSLHDALAAIEDKILPPGRGVTIHIEQGVYIHDRPVEFTRPDGGLLRIIGAGAENTILRFPESDGVIVHRLARLGLIDAVRIEGFYELGGAREPYTDGIRVDRGASAQLGPDVHVQGFSDHCLQVNGGRLIAEEAEINDCGYNGIFAYRGAHVWASRTRIRDTLSYSMTASSGSMIECEECSIGGTRDGAYAANLSHIRFRDSAIEAGTVRRWHLRALRMGSIFDDGVTGLDRDRVEVDAHSLAQ